MNCWRGGWSGEHRSRRPNEALDWAGIRWAAEQGLRWYDFHGDADYTQGFGGVQTNLAWAAGASFETAVTPDVPAGAPTTCWTLRAFLG
jgi:hypothetical protein